MEELLFEQRGVLSGVSAVLLVATTSPFFDGEGGAPGGEDDYSNLPPGFKAVVPWLVVGGQGRAVWNGVGAGNYAVFTWWLRGLDRWRRPFAFGGL